MTPLDALIQQRTGGAFNVRGIRFQVLYTLWRALRAHADGGLWRVLPETLEDVDIEAGGVTEHVQVKTSKNPWQPNKLGDALGSIVEAARACEGDPTHAFSVLLAGDVGRTVAALAERADLAPPDRATLDKTLTKHLVKAGASQALADRLTSSLALRVSDLDALDDLLRTAFVEAFDAHPDAADLGVHALTAFVLDRAQRREPFGPAELNAAYVALSDAQTTASAFEARGRALVAPVDWTPTDAPDDFADGRGTRPGHIAADLDVERPTWSRRIAEVLGTSRLCVVRAPSGQGKSTIALRFARDHWDPQATLSLNACATPADASRVIDYLRARADLGVPTTLLVDGADARLQRWPEVAAAARDRGIPVLATVRVEDWRRFAASSAVDLGPHRDARDTPAGPLDDVAVVEPDLGLDEARALYRRLQALGRVHPTVPSAEDAYERIDRPALLMEYVYLLTHGELLRHRLGGQIQTLQRAKDDAHLDVLRLATFAHTCGVPLPVAALFDHRPEDPQRVLSQLDGEYVRRKDGDLSELHRVRSEHLTTLLHDGGLPPADTARRVLPLLPDARLAPFVAGAFRYPGLDRDALFPHLARLAVERGPATAAAIADGLFESGERDYGDAVAPSFDRAEALMGSPGPFFLSFLLAPFQKPEIFDGLTDTVDQLPNDAGDRFRQIRTIAAEAAESERGHDRVRPLLAQTLPRLAPAALLGAPGPAGRLLQEAHTLGLAYPHAPDLLATLAPPAPADVPAFASLVLGLYDQAPAETEWWVREHAAPLGHAVADHLGLVGPPELMPGPEGPAVDVAFYPDDSDDAPQLNDQAVSCLRLVRELYPFAVHFRSRARWLVPPALVPTHDESIKDMTPQHLQPRLFRDRQGLWNVLGKERAASPTFWAYQRGWHTLRTLAVGFAEAVEQAVRAVVEGRPFDLSRALSRDDLEARLHQALRSAPKLPVHASPVLSEALKDAERWHSAFDNVVSQTVQFAKAQANGADSGAVGRLLRSNAYDAAAKVEGMHRAFDALLDRVPDSVGLRDLRDRERKAYLDLAGALEFWTAPPVPVPVQSLRKALRESHDRLDQALRSRVVQALRDAGVEPSAPVQVVRDHLAQPVVLVLPTDHPNDPKPDALGRAILAVADMYVPVAPGGRFDGLWIALSFQGRRFERGATRLYAHQLSDLAAGKELAWESFAALPAPAPVADALGAVPFEVSPEYEAWKAALGARALGMYVEGHLRADPSADPRVLDAFLDLLSRAEHGMHDVANRLRSLAGGAPLPVRAADRIDAVGEAFGQGVVPADDILALIDDLQPGSPEDDGRQ